MFSISYATFTSSEDYLSLGPCVYSSQRRGEEEEIVIEEAGGRILMLGPLRAKESCLACHTARVGELLGAYSYELAPAEAQNLPALTAPAPPQASIGRTRHLAWAA
jgi:hypothetical protein